MREQYMRSGEGEIIVQLKTDRMSTLRFSCRVHISIQRDRLRELRRDLQVSSADFAR